MTALIPARSGSKRIVDKNIRMVHGAPMMHHPLIAAVKSGLFSQVLVSTDSDRYLHIARHVDGVDGFIRPAQLANDTAPLEAVLADAMRRYPIETEWCLLLPTAIGIAAHELREIGDYFTLAGYDAVVTVTMDDRSAERAMALLDDGRAVPLSRRWIRKRTQDVRQTYHDAGQLYFIKRQPFLWRWTLLRQDILLQRPGTYVLTHAVDIDTPRDLEAAGC